jgi:transcriptional regulator with XRE-family HTH domain
MARAAIELGVRALAEAAKVSTNTITRFERGEPLRERTVDAVRAALESAGVEFIAENGGGPGVRLKKPRPDPDSIAAEDLNASNDE